MSNFSDFMINKTVKDAEEKESIQIALTDSIKCNSQLTDEITHLKSELEKCQSACAEMREKFEHLADAVADQDTTAFHVHKVLTSTDCGQAFLDRLHASEQRVKELADQCNQPLCALLSCFDSQHDESGLHQPTGPIQAVDYELAQEALTALHKATGEVKS